MALAAGLLLGSCGTDPESERAGEAPQAGASDCGDARLSPAGRVTAAQTRAARRGRFEVFGPEPVVLRPPVDWGEDPLDARRYQQNLHKLRYLDPLLEAHRLHDGLRDLRRAKAIAVDWMRSNPPPRPEQPDRIEWTDKVVADRVPYLAYINRTAACEGLLGRRERRLMRRSLRAHGSFLADEDNYADDNHGLFVDLGLLRLARLAPGLSEAPAWERLARERFARTLRRHSAEGLWLEHSTAYQLLVIRPLERMLEVLDEQQGQLAEALEEMREAAAWMVRPDGQLVQFGDSNLERVPGWARQRARELDGLRIYRRAGMAFVRDRGPEPERDGHLAVSAGHHSAKHKHSDDLGFELHDRGLRIVSDTGLFHKDVGPMRDFVLSAEAHSVLTVDGEPLPIPPAREAYGSGLLGGAEGAGWFALAGENPLTEEQEVEHRRLFAYRPGEILLVVDRLRADAEHTYNRYLQLGSELRARRDVGAIELKGRGLRGEVLPFGSEPEAIELERGERDPMAGWTSPDFRELVPRWRARFDDHASDALLGLAIRLGPAAPRPLGLRERDGSVEISLLGEGGRSTLRVGTDGSEVSEAPRMRVSE